MAEDFSGDDEEGMGRDMGQGPNPASLAMSSASREQADRYLDAQMKLLRLQTEDIHEQRLLVLSHLKWRRFDDQISGALRIILVAFGLLVVVLVGAAIWNASHFRGLIAEPLKTPPDFAAKGLDGTVLSQRLLDKLTSRKNVAQEDSLVEPAAITGSWGSDSKVQIPATDVSIDEAWRLLRGWLGRETRISGEVWRTDKGVALTVRTAENPGETFVARDGELDALLDKAADALMNETQPALYNDLLLRNNQFAAAAEQARSRTGRGSAFDRANAYTDLGNALAGKGNNRAAIEPYARSIALAPGDPIRPFFALNTDIALDHAQVYAERVSLVLGEFEAGAPSIYRPDVVTHLPRQHAR